MRIKSIHINAFRGLKEFDLSFVDAGESVRQVTVIAGVNGSGKTTVLDFINNNLTHNFEIKKNIMSGQVTLFDNGQEEIIVTDSSVRP